MAQQTFPLSHFTTPGQAPQQRSFYTPSPSPAPANHINIKPNMAPLKNCQPSTASYQLQNHGPPPMAPPPPLPALPAPADPLEQRVLDLLYPYRDECFEDEDTKVNLTQERLAHVLSGNLAFLIRHNQASYGKQIEPNDIFVASRFFKGGVQASKDEKDKPAAGVGVFVNGNGYTHTVVRVFLKPEDNALEFMTAQVDELMAPFFPGS